MTRPSFHVKLGLLVLLVALLLPRGADARPSAAPGGPASTPTAESEGIAEAEPVVSPDSPLASMRSFLELCRAGDYEGAAGFLELPRDQEEAGPELARRLEAVLARRMPLERAELSPASRGSRGDDLPRNVDEIGTIALHDGTTEPVLLVRRLRPEPRWVFSRATVARVDTWYAQLDNYWLLANLPPVLLSPGPWGIPWWQWIALPVLLLGAAVLGWLLARGVRWSLVRMIQTADATLLVQLTRPLTVLWGLGIVYVVLPLLGVHLQVEAFVDRGLRITFLVTVFWVLAGLLDLSSGLIMRSPWALSHPSGSALVPLARRISKVALVGIALVAVFADLGYPVASMLTGLGLGGLVLALAAQKTVENLLGTFSIGADQPFHEGDYVRIEDFEGTVEAIGLRSTRFRTLDRTLVTIPNGKLAEMRIESYSARDRTRVTCTLGLVYHTTPEQLRGVLDGCEAVLRGHPKIWSDTMVVRVSNFGASSIDIEVMAWFRTTDWLELRQCREEALIGFMEVVRAAGTAFAFPTRTVHMAAE